MGISVEQFGSQNASKAIKNSIAETLHVSVKYVTILQVTAGSTTQRLRNRLLAALSSILVSYSVLIPNTVLPASSFQTTLTNAVTSGEFTVRLHSNAVKYSASNLLNASSSSIFIGNIYFITSIYVCHLHKM